MGEGMGAVYVRMRGFACATLNVCVAFVFGKPGRARRRPLPTSSNGETLHHEKVCIFQGRPAWCHNRGSGYPGQKVVRR